MFLPLNTTLLLLALILLMASTLVLWERIRTYKLMVTLAKKESEDFISMAIFQIRAPLTAISGYSSLILEGDYGQTNKETGEAVSAIQSSAHNLVGVVDDYVNMLRLELGQMKYSFEKTNLKALTEEVVAEFRIALVGRKIVLAHHTTGTSDAFSITADASKIKQVVRNLIDNAVKYTPSGDISIYIDTSGEINVIMSIRDSGTGLESAILPKLFERFDRTNNKNSPTVLAGTGLGLYIARKIVEAHHGRIWAESAGKNQGSTFYVALPKK